MLLAIITYTKPLDEVDLHLKEHRQFLQNLLEQKKLLMCGRLHPRTGGIIIAHNLSLSAFEECLSKDPFQSVAHYNIMEFTPLLQDPSLREIIEKLSDKPSIS